ncbi:hypothetical protein HYX70_04170 [Candidatus Saccharibacteria bacterium]|nr:hypothetical protein [Candidatus Saccharibacteria bacterium]
MQKIATRVFVGASILFGVFGVLFVITAPGRGGDNSSLNTTLMKLLFATGFVVLSSFALSVAGKYLNSK